MKTQIVILNWVVFAAAVSGVAEQQRFTYHLPAASSGYVLQTPTSEATVTAVSEKAVRATLAAAGLYAKRRQELYEVSPSVTIVVGQREREGDDRVDEAVFLSRRSGEVVARFVFEGEPYSSAVVGATVVKLLSLSAGEPGLVAVGLVTYGFGIRGTHNPSHCFWLRLLVLSGDKVVFESAARQIGEAMIWETPGGVILGDIELPRLLAADVNGDGFNDVVMWTRSYSSEKASGSKCKDRSLNFVGESVQVALFDPQARGLAAFQKRPDLSPPDISLFYDGGPQEPGGPNQWPGNSDSLLGWVCPPLPGR